MHKSGTMQNVFANTVEPPKQDRKCHHVQQCIEWLDEYAKKQDNCKKAVNYCHCRILQTRLPSTLMQIRWRHGAAIHLIYAGSPCRNYLFIYFFHKTLLKIVRNNRTKTNKQQKTIKKNLLPVGLHTYRYFFFFFYSLHY